MKRIERPPLVLYVDRDLLGSFLCFWMLCLVLPLAWHGSGAPILRNILVGAAALFALGAFLLLFQARVFAVDRTEGELRVLERTLPWLTRRTRIPLHELSIWMLVRSEGSDPRPMYGVFIAPKEGPAILFRKGRSVESVRAAADLFGADVGREIHLGDWTP